ncbi:(Dimethylallyl)adenosine tRNA methylthiotransferase MiaB [Alistipes sp. CAG:831]|nr:(Dimethylallyl)adenosine tRNA methylthiotransferase MiaB [Alistipes sp. CAG:831]
MTNDKRIFIETYGCQMNVYDSEIVLSVLEKEGYTPCKGLEEADLIMVNTCSIRDNAEQRVWGRLDRFLQEKKHRRVTVGVLGCMAERLKQELLTHPAVDLVAGPDTYRDLPRMLHSLEDNGEKQVNTVLSLRETYADIDPVRTDAGGVTTFISIMRGCNNMCTYCIVPYVRGGERSRDPQSIVKEAERLYAAGYREVSLLGQNVDSYLWKNPENPTETVNFAQLIELVALVAPDMRVRFSTSHPKDMSNGVLYSMAMYPNICTHIHLPVQSGSDRMLEKMNRKYTVAGYLERIEKIREIVPEAAITTDIIAGFCSETEEDHRATLELMQKVRFDSAFMFQYSQRPGTKAARHFPDDVPPEVKTRRLNEIIELQSAISLERNRECVGQTYEVLIEGTSKRDSGSLFGRTSSNKVCVFPALGHRPGEYVKINVESCTSATLLGNIVE